MAGDVITTGTRAVDAAAADAPRDTDPAVGAEKAEAAGTASVPASHAANATSQESQTSDSTTIPEEPEAGPDLATRTQPKADGDAAGRARTGRTATSRSTGQARTGRARGPRAAVAAAAGQAADVAASSAGVRRRLARLGAQRGATINPVLEPLIKTVRATHPKADIRLVERAYDTAAHWHRDQKRKSGDPFITHPLAVATILAELGMPTQTICAALLHDTVEDTLYTLTELRGEFGEDIAALVDGVTKLDKVKYGESAEAETVRKMVVAMSRDIRVLVIKLADR
ncbi:MAG: HD domain-containing protein, partial [Streptosporangiaceae bacterium]